ncbi:MAG: hypothetical protein IJW51_01590 [Clostridia bacterium]|nr:hypothetical protein [Clostridia bacterium]
MKKFVRILSLTLVVVMLCATLASCGAPAKDAADAVTALKEEGYVAVNDTTVTPLLFKAAGYELTSVVTGSKVVEDKDGNKSTEIVVVYYFADKDNAEKALDKVKENAKEKQEESAENWVEPTRSGSMVYFGTKAAIKAAK